MNLIIFIDNTFLFVFVVAAVVVAVVADAYFII